MRESAGDGKEKEREHVAEQSHGIGEPLICEVNSVSNWDSNMASTG